MKKAFVSNTPVGVFAVDEKENLIAHIFYSKDPKKALEEFKKGPTLELKDYEITEDTTTHLIRKTSIEKKHFSSDKEFNKFISEFSSLLSAIKLSESIDKDKLLLHSISALTEINETQNMVFMRLKEWFSLHYPEEKSIGKELAEKIKKYRTRENFPGFTSSFGVGLNEEDSKILKNFASLSENVSEIEKQLEEYSKKLAKKLMPTTCTIVNPILAGRILAHAGTLEKLSRMTASTIQLLGAEKALFRHIKKQGKSPKYGLIFMDSRIQEAHDTKKAKVARVISSKLMMAVKIDYFSKRKDEKLAKELENELSKL